MTTFEQYLGSVRKRNGEKYTDSTIERYLYWFFKYQVELQSLVTSEQTLYFCNDEVRKTQNHVLYAMFKAYLKYAGIPTETLESPGKRANFNNSQRYLHEKVLSQKELDKLFMESDDNHFRGIISCLYDTACRRAELMSIRAEDIDVRDPNNVLHKKDIEGGIYASAQVMGKGEKRRMVCFTKRSLVYIQYLLKIRQPTDKLFVVKNTYGVPYANQSDGLYKLVIKNGYKILNRRVHPHMFRHTKLTNLADDGVDVLAIGAYAGHSGKDLRTTLVYIQISSHLAKSGFIIGNRDILGNRVDS